MEKEIENIREQMTMALEMREKYNKEFKSLADKYQELIKTMEKENKEKLNVKSIKV